MARVIIFLNRLIIGGTALDTIQMANSLSEEHEVFLVVGEKLNDEYDAFFLAGDLQKVKVIALHDLHRSVYLSRDITAFFKIRRLIRDIKPDIVHTNGAKPGFLCRIAARLSGVKIILHTYHGHVFHSYFNSFVSRIIILLERLLARITTRIIALSDSQKKELVEKYRIADESKIEVIRMSIDTSKFNGSLASKREKFRADYLVHPDEIAIGIVGRIVPVKNHHLFLEVSAEILKNTNTKVRFFIVGDGILRQELEEKLLADNLPFTHFPANPVRKAITFTSWILNVEEVMAGLDIVVLTSLNEGTPISLMEAQAAGTPVVSTNVGAVNELVLHEKTGLIVAANTKEDIVTALMRLIENNSLREKMGIEGHRFIHEHFSKKHQLESIKDLYRNLLSSSFHHP